MVYAYKVVYDGGVWIGTCKEYPNLSFCSDSYVDAYVKIKKLVKKIDEEIEDEVAK